MPTTQSRNHASLSTTLDDANTRWRLAIVFLSTYAVLLAASGTTQIVDPFIHYDDYPALIPDPAGYYTKTLTEGRWINYWWHLRGIATPAWFNFQLYLIGFGVFVSAAALNIFRTADIRYPALLAAFCAVSPQTTLIAGWFNTLVPGVWLLAAYALAALFVSPRTGLALLFLFVPATLQAYTSYPFLLLAICLLRQDQTRSIREFMVILAAFVASFGLAILIIYALNYQVHGVFGIQLADWRNPNPVGDLGGLKANLPRLAESLHWIYVMSGFGKPVFSLTLATAVLASVALLARTSPIEVLHLLTGLFLGLALLGLHALKEGIDLPFRSTYFLWFIAATAIVKAVHLVQTGTRRTSSAPIAAVLLLTLVAGSFTRIHGQQFGAWQVQTRDLAARITATDTIYIYGSYLDSGTGGDSWAQMPRDLQYRLAHLTGARAEMCTEEPEACAGVTPPFDPPETGDPLLVRNSGADTFLRLPVTASAE